MRPPRASCTLGRVWTDMVALDAERERARERTVRALAGDGPCPHGVWQHEKKCAVCRIMECYFNGLFARDVQ